MLRRDDPPVCDAAAAALRALTGQDFGTDANKWEAWLGAGRKAPREG